MSRLALSRPPYGSRPYLRAFCTFSSSWPSDHGGSHRAFHVWSTEIASSSDKVEAPHDAATDSERPKISMLASDRWLDRLKKSPSAVHAIVERTCDAALMRGTARLAARASRSQRESPRAPAQSRGRRYSMRTMPRFLVLVIHKARQTGRLRARRRSRIRVELARQAFLQAFHVAAFEVLAFARTRGADRARNGARRTAAADQVASSRPPGGPDRRRPPRERRAGPPRSRVWSSSGRAPRR